MGIKQSKTRYLSTKYIDFVRNNTHLEEDQVKKWSKEFVQDCPKGHLTREQAMNLYRDLFPAGSAQGFCEHVFHTFDPDKTGYVHFKEFLLALNITSGASPPKKLEWAFRLFEDGLGLIDQWEMIKIVEAIYEMLGPSTVFTEKESPRAHAIAIFEKMDTNKDKLITQKEFIDGCTADKEIFQFLTNEVKK